MLAVLLNELGRECYTAHFDFGVIVTILDLIASQEVVLQSSNVYMV